MAAVVNRRDEFDDQGRWQPMSCAVCTACFKNMVLFVRTGRIRCLFGGPFIGFEYRP